ncbi:MAG: DNA polymerase III subunit delta [Betaproteobacteria bacterium]|nr:DNA polymerase III subunit delta [Betaproteobacteria bacterium]
MSRLNADQLTAHLQRGLAALYLIYGDEPLLALEAADAIRAQARHSGYAEREVFTVEAGFNWQTLLASGNSMSLFSAKRIIEIRIPTGKPGTEGGQALQEYCARLPDDTVTLISCPKLDKQAQATKWFKALEQAGTLVPVYPVERAKLPQWIGQRLAAQNQRADSATTQFLADRVEGNLLAAHQEIQKLGLLFPAGPLNFDQIREAVLDVSRYDVFNLSDAMLAGDAGRMARILDGLKGEGVAPTLALWALTQEIRTLTRLKQGQRKGASLPQLLRDMRVWESRQSLMQRALGRLSETRLIAGLKQAAALDRMIKGLAQGDVWDELLQLGLGVASSK